MEQTPMFPVTYDIEGRPLTGCHEKIYDAMKDGQWRTLTWLASTVNMAGSSASSCLRNLRKEKYGGYIVERRHVKNSLYEYRLIV